MLDFIFKLLPFLNSLRKDIPDCIGYEIYETTSFSLPREIKEILTDKNNAISLLKRQVIRIDNYSMKSKKNIRVIYYGCWSFSPDFIYRKRDSIDVSYRHLEDNKEIIIDELLPNESVLITLYNPSKDFHVIQILFGDEEVTKTMQLLAERKRDPELSRLRFFNMVLYPFILVVAILLFGLSIWKIYDTVNYNNEVIRKQNIINAARDKAYEGLDLCYLDVFKNDKTKFNENIEKSAMSIENVIHINNVKSIDELKNKEDIVLCIKYTN